MAEESEEKRIPNLPKKADYRQRAHCNPLSDRTIPYPIAPDAIDWKDFYPVLKEHPETIAEHFPTILDIGCGFGGMTFALSPLFPKNLILAFEIRCQVTTYVDKKIKAYQAQGLTPNIAVQWGNTMRTLMRYCDAHTVEKVFVLFPDPQFKKKKLKWRIISQQLMDEYAYIMKPGARFYLVTDVRQYFEYADPLISSHPLFEKVADPQNDQCFELAQNATEESKKVTENGGMKFAAIWQRKPLD
jgi:tRNA (guanine-N7-)-methyltransferase